MAEALTTAFGTKYFPMEAYEKSKGTLKLRKGVKDISSTAAKPEVEVDTSDPTIALLLRIGLSNQKALETKKNEALVADIERVMTIYGDGDVEKSKGNLLYEVASKIKSSKSWIEPHLPLLVESIKNGNVATTFQLGEGFTYLKKAKGKFDTDEWKKATGIGITVSEDAVINEVKKVIENSKEQLLVDRYHTPIGKLMAGVKKGKDMKWADATFVKQECEKQLAALLGPRTAADDVPPVKKKVKGPKKAKKEEEAILTFTGASASFHAPGHNYETDGYVTTPKTMELLAQHLKETGGKVMTRFPPEPNGILHIGHAKAINFNFSYARERNGHCYLRYDDTNPEAEDEEFFIGIRRDVEWLGHKPYKITHSSDYFQQLYDLAVDLIHRGLAYVCHMKVEDIQGHDQVMSPYRERPKEESLQLFEDMKNGLIDEGEATLRMKHIMGDGKVDPVCYRVKFVAHHRTGNDWCIYPTYDYTHCLCDSFENISHSLCTKEFQNRRPSYYWLCNALDQYCPVQWEYSRLNLSYAVVSKRKILKLINGGHVSGWDDPRLFTLAALRRRGFPPEAISDFVAKVGVSVNSMVAHPDMLESCVRDRLNKDAHRVMAVLDPIRVVIENIDSKQVDSVTVPNIPFDESAGTHEVPFTSVVYIDQDDFQETAPKDFRRLTAKQPVGLKHVGKIITAKTINKDSTGKVVEIIATATDVTPKNKPAAWIHWVSGPSSHEAPTNAEVRVYDLLFHHSSPEDPRVVPGGFLNDVNADSLKVYHDAMIDSSCVAGPPEVTRYQFERLGFFVVDKDSTSDRLVFNRVIALKQDSKRSS